MSFSFNLLNVAGFCEDIGNITSRLDQISFRMTIKGNEILHLCALTGTFEKPQLVFFVWLFLIYGFQVCKRKCFLMLTKVCILR